MKKLILIFLTLLTLSACGARVENATSSDSAKDNKPTLSITVMPSPPETKTTQDAAEIRRFTELIESFEKTEAPCEDINGWEISVNYYDGDKTVQYSLLGDTLRIGGKCYKADGAELTEAIMKIYDDI